jgi:hypothetical protein
MKFLFTLMCILCASISLVLGQGAEGFNRFQEKSVDFNSGNFVGENGINWNFTQCKNYSVVGEAGIEKSRLELGKDTTAEIISSVISGGVGLLKIDYSTFSSAPVKLDVFVNRLKVATLIATSSENSVTLSSDNINVNLDKPFYIRIKQSDETSGQVIIEKVLWSQFGSKDFGILYDSYVPPKANAATFNVGILKEYGASYHVFPNPAKEFVMIEMSDNKSVSFKLYTLAGQMVLQEQVKGSGQKINIGSLKEGLYIYKIFEEKGKMITGKLIIR